jgi:Raf kinase inhibitor-like YbhB/YbcL family protein
MRISSPAFSEMSKIPEKFTCDGENINPPLEFFEVPEGAKNLVLIVDDPDAPMGTFAHWLVWNMEATTLGIPEGEKPVGAEEGFNDANGKGYTGPCPPSGTHHYRFKLYALDRKLDLSPNSRIEHLEKELEVGVIDKAELIGIYASSS